MAKNRKQANVPPTLESDQALIILRRQRERGSELLGYPLLEYDVYNAWEITTKEMIEHSFGSTSQNLERFQSISRPHSMPLLAGRLGEPQPQPTPPTPQQQSERMKQFVRGKQNVLSSCIEQLETLSGHLIELGSKTSAASRNPSVFLVHGRDEGIRESVARFLEKLGLSVTILHEHANKGRTIIEKFEEFADVGFAVVLLTGDDRGGLAETPPKDFHPRARQNVILELGFFLGKLGRERVCALYEPGVDIPSDFSGILFVEIDLKRRWHVELARELKAAGFAVDMNRLFE